MKTVVLVFGMVGLILASASLQPSSPQTPESPFFILLQILADNDSDDLPLETRDTGEEPVIPVTPPPGETVELPGTDYMSCTGVGKCERIYCQKGACRYDECKVDQDCSKELIEYQNEMRRRYGSASGTGSCFGMFCRAILNESAPIGHPCDTDADCGGINLFSSMLGTGLEAGMEMKPPFKQLLGNERVNFVADGETGFVVLENGVITEAGDGGAGDNSVNVKTDIQTIERIQMEETSVEEAIYKNEITIEGEGFFNGIKFWFAKLVYDMFYTPTDAG